MSAAAPNSRHLACWTQYHRHNRCRRRRRRRRRRRPPQRSRRCTHGRQWDHTQVEPAGGGGHLRPCRGRAQPSGGAVLSGLVNILCPGHGRRRARGATTCRTAEGPRPAEKVPETLARVKNHLHSPHGAAPNKSTTLQPGIADETYDSRPRKTAGAKAGDAPERRLQPGIADKMCGSRTRTLPKSHCQNEPQTAGAKAGEAPERRL